MKLRTIAYYLQFTILASIIFYLFTLDKTIFGITIVSAILQLIFSIRAYSVLSVLFFIIQLLFVALIFIPYLGYIIAIIYFIFTLIMLILFQFSNAVVVGDGGTRTYSNNSQKKSSKSPKKVKRSKNTNFKDAEFKEK